MLHVDYTIPPIINKLNNKKCKLYKYLSIIAFGKNELCTIIFVKEFTYLKNID